MIIESLSVSNFRAIRETVLECDRLTMLLGRNGAGKSTFLHALDIFYNVAAPITLEDFHNRDTTRPIEVRVTYAGLKPEELREFEAYIAQSRLTVTKRISLLDGTVSQHYFAATLQIPSFAEIRRLSGKLDRRRAWRDLVDSQTLDGLEGVAKSAEEVDALMEAFEAKHPEVLVTVEGEAQFFGPRNIGGGKLDKYTKFLLVPAVHEATEETAGRRSAVYQILDALVLRRIQNRKDVQEFQVDLQQRLRALFSPENLTELGDIAQVLSQSLAVFAPGARLSLQWDDPTMPVVQIPTASVTVTEDDFEGEIGRKGHGLQRALILTLLRELAMLNPEAAYEDESFGAGSRGDGMWHASPDLILGIEEPELYLHPSRCRYLASILHQLTEPANAGTPANQVLLTTHSPHFVDLHRFDGIRVVRKTRVAGTIPHTTLGHFRLGDAIHQLASAAELDPATFTRESFVARTVPVMTGVVSEGFFAEAVLLVEGLSEAGALWRLQDLLGSHWTELGIVVIPVGGKNSLDRPTVIFRGLLVPTYVVFDGDVRLRGKDQEEKAATDNHKCLRLLGGVVEDFPATIVQPTWAVFADNIEDEIQQAVGAAAFEQLRGEAAAKLGYEEGPALKNIDCMALFVQRLYEDGHSVPVLEEIVKNVSALVSSGAGLVE